MKGEMNSFMLLFEEQVTVMDMNQVLTFLDPQAVEIWTEVNLMEITTETGTITFEDMMHNLRKSDQALLETMQMKQVYACDYTSEDSGLVKKIMTVLLEQFHGRIGSDTEDFSPFLTVSKLP